jgi:uncharacterized short protein YbdD (DUF466 family)
MKPSDLAGPAATRCGAASMPGEVSVHEDAPSGRARGIVPICRQIFGIPDYERYLAHAGARHPGAPVLSRRDFCAQAIERKYGKSGPRCC